MNLGHMSSVSVLLALFLVGCALASDVLEFKESDFDEKIAEHDIVLLEFYAPWCGHCKRLAPEYEKAATKLLKNDPPIALAKVDCTAEKAVCDKFGVSGFPTLKIFRKGEFSAEYGGPREADGIMKYMRSQVGPSSVELKTKADLDKFIKNEDYSVIGFFEKETRLKDSFMKVADTERDRYRFAHTSSKELLDSTDYTDDIVIYQPPRLHSKFEDPEIRYTGNYDTEKIKKFIESDMLGLCGHRTMDNAGSFEKPLFVAYYNVDYVRDPKGTNYWRNRILKVAKELGNPKVHFAIANLDDFNPELAAYGLEKKKDSKTPIVAAHGADGGKYPMDADFSMDNLKQFVQDVMDGKVEPFLKSEPIPESNDAPVKVAVAKNFKELIMTPDKDALVEFYAPWCGHCKKLAPIYDELAEKLAKEDVIIAKMDATANDPPPGFDVQGFPTLFWLPKGKKDKPVPYHGGRELDDFIKYIAKESTDGLKRYDRNGKKKKKSEL